MATSFSDTGIGFSRTYTGQGYNVSYFARKYGISKQQARDIIRKVGHDRDKLHEAAAQLKA